MAKEVYIFRHQSGGFLNDFVFSEPPTPQQTQAIKKICAQRYGAKHAKTGADYWIKVFRLPTMGPNDVVPVSKSEDGNVANAASVPQHEVNAVARVENRK